MAVANLNGAAVQAMYLAPGYIKQITSTDGTETVPAGESWEVLNARGVITTTATVGNRTFTLRVLNGSAVAYAASATSNLAASQTNAVRETTLTISFWAAAGSEVRFTDTAAIDAANDTLSIVFTVRVFPIPQ